MSAGRYDTAARDRVPFTHKLAYGTGALVNNLLAGAIGGMIIVLNLGFGMNPALVGLLAAIPRLTDAFTDPVMGYITDQTRSRWGRRRPYIFAGAIAVALIYALLWQMPAGRSETFYFTYFLIGSILFYMAYTVFATPWVALGYELTADYHERTRLMGVQNFIGQFAYIVTPWFLWIMTNERWFESQAEGAAALAIIIALVVAAVGVVPAIVLREPFQRIATIENRAAQPARGGITRTVAEFLRGTRITLASRPFLKLCAAAFLVFNGFILISSFQYYVIIYYVFGGDQALGAKYAGYSGTLGAISTFLVIIAVTKLGTAFGKRRAFFIATGISIVGYVLKWFTYSPEHPWLLLLPAPLMAFGLGGLFTLMPSMIADVVDADELETHERREGMYGSIFWFVLKLGMAVALAGGGVLLNLTGFEVALGGAQSHTTITLMRMFDAFMPAATSLLAIWAVARFPITEESARGIREELEARRGRAEALTS